jgi:RimJ/RimL family protein N-acetyltransferase
MPAVELLIPRLRMRLRQWQARDLAPYAALSADPEVMRASTAHPVRADRRRARGSLT